MAPILPTLILAWCEGSARSDSSYCKDVPEGCSILAFLCVI